MAAAVAERIELLHVADGEPVCASTQARSPISKVRCASGSNGPNGSPARGSSRVPCGEDRGLLVLDRDDRRGKADFNRGKGLLAHQVSRL